jgi:hypothetical protein
MISPDMPRAWVRRYGLVAAGIVLVVAAVVAGALRLDRQLRPPLQTVALQGATASAPTLASASAATDVVGANDNPSQAASAASASAASSSAVSMSPLAQEVQTAYLHYWDIREQAYLTLDASHLSDVMTGNELARAQKQIADMKAQNQAAKLQVDHHIAVAQVTSDHAVVLDEYVNRSVYVNPVTREEIPTSAPSETLSISFDMRKVDGIWKVDDGFRNS